MSIHDFINQLSATDLKRSAKLIESRLVSLKDYKYTGMFKPYQDIIDANEGRLYHDIQMEKHKLNNDGRLRKLVKSYTDETYDNFIKRVNNPKAFLHKSALNQWVEEFGQDKNNAYNFFLHRAYDIIDWRPAELKDIEFEKKIIQGYTAFTSDDDAFIRKFKDLFKLKVAAQGYKGMHSFISHFFEKHPLSDKANKLHLKLLSSIPK
jgi:hypothetical protein